MLGMRLRRLRAQVVLQCVPLRNRKSENMHNSAFLSPLRKKTHNDERENVGETDMDRIREGKKSEIDRIGEFQKFLACLWGIR